MRSGTGSMTTEIGFPDREVKISWSRMRDAEECTEKAWLLSQGKKSPVTDVRNFYRGNVVDLCMRTWLDQDDPLPGQMLAMVDAMMDKVASEGQATGDGVVQWKNPSDKEEVRAWCKDLVTRLEPILGRLALPYGYQPAVRFEVPLTIPYLDGSPQRIWLRGEMDLLCQESMPDGGLDYAGPRRIHVWDLKGTADDSYWRKVTGQLVFYDIAAFLMLGAWPVRSGLIQPMCQEPVLTFTWTEDQRREMFTRITRIAEGMWRGDHAPKVSNAGCDRCPVRHACPKWAVTGRGRAPVGR